MNPGAFRMLLAGMVAFSHTAGPNVGRPAVFLFFVLSGFWVSCMWAERYVHCRKPYVTFLISRAWRLLPVYWICYFVTLAICVLTERYSDSEWALVREPLWIARTMIIVSSASQFKVLTSAWSLDYEMQFYIICPIVYLGFSRLWKHSKVATWVCCLSLLFFYVIGFRPWPSTVFQYLGFFGFGVIAYLSTWNPNPILVKVSFIALLIMFFSLCLLFVLQKMNIGSLSSQLEAIYFYTDSLTGIIGLPAAINSCRQPSDSLDRALGAISYPLYLVQKFVDVAFEQMLRGAAIKVKILSLPLQWAIMLFLSFVIYKWIDRIIDRERQKWVTARLVGRA